MLPDVTEQDDRWAGWSQEQISQHVGRMVVDPIIHTEKPVQARRVHLNAEYQG